jgi:hypothetical protein
MSRHVLPSHFLHCILIFLSKKCLKFLEETIGLGFKLLGGLPSTLVSSEIKFPQLPPLKKDLNRHISKDMLMVN